MRRHFSPRHVLFCLFALGAAFASVHVTIAAEDEKPLEWRVLLIVKDRGEIKAEGFPDVTYQMRPGAVASVKAAFAEHTAEYVATLSKGRLVWKPEVVVSPLPLRKVSKLGKGTWVGPECVAEDIAKLAPLGRYDGIFVYWKDSDDETKKNVQGGFGWSIGPTEGANGCGYSCVNFVNPRDFTRDSEWTEVFLHEWLHQLEAFYASKGVKLPRGGLHGDANYGYKHQGGWKHWYRAFLHADLSEKDGTRVGLGEKAWRLGTIRDELAPRLPEYLTADRRRSDLLKDGSFEAGVSAWTTRSWKNNPKAASVVEKVAKSGSASLMLRSESLDDAMSVQKVAVKPKTRYLLSGWIKTEGVAIDPNGGAMGASLSIWGGFEATRSVSGTSEWTYAALMFDSGVRKEIEVGPRLGHHGSIASGTAWFDDLVMIELPRTGDGTTAR